MSLNARGKGLGLPPLPTKTQTSSHIMRRTAITTMLSLGMPESMVRRISSHAPRSKELYRYVNWVQAYQDQETERVFEILQVKQLGDGNVLH